MRHVTDHMQAYIDAELGPAERDRVERHCARCAACAAELAARQAVWANVDAAIGADRPRLRRSLVPQMRRRLRDRTQQGGLAGAWSGRRPPRSLRAGLAGAAAAAGLVAGLVVGGPGWTGLDGAIPGAGGSSSRDDTVNLLAESSNLYGGDWALDRIWLTAAGEEESSQ